MFAKLRTLNSLEKTNSSVSTAYAKLTWWCRGPGLNRRQLGLQLRPQSRKVIGSSALPGWATSASCITFSKRRQSFLKLSDGSREWFSFALVLYVHRVQDRHNSVFSVKFDIIWKLFQQWRWETSDNIECPIPFLNCWETVCLEFKNLAAQCIGLESILIARHLESIRIARSVRFCGLLSFFWFLRNRATTTPWIQFISF